jgi:hypothetical protein
MDHLLLPNSIYQHISSTIGALPVETGGIFSVKGNTITDFYFDADAATTSHCYTPNSDRITEQVNRWLQESGKTLGGLVRCPISMQNAYGDFFFYSEHLVGVMSEIFGFYPKTVQAFEKNGVLTVVFRYEDYDIIGQYTEGYYSYYASRSSEEGIHGENFPLETCFKAEFDEYYSLLCGGEQKKSYEDFIAPVFVLNAIKCSLDSGKEEKVNEYTI